MNRSGFVFITGAAILYFVVLTAAGRATAEVVHLKAKQGDLVGVVEQLDSGVPVDLPATNYVPVKVVSPLFVAAQFDHAEVVAELFNRGADPSLTFGSNAGGTAPVGTPLHAAAGNGHAEVVQLLLDAGADINAHTSATGPPLHLARARGHDDVARLRLSEGSTARWDAPSISGTQADVENGKRLARGCVQCHGEPLSGGMSGDNGPNLWGVVGRNAGEMHDYVYSTYLADSGVVRTADDLNSFLASPYRFVPGTIKYPTEITDQQSRIDLIGYLATLTD